MIAPLGPSSAPVVARVAGDQARAVERAASWRMDLRRACRWLASISTAPAALREGPLFGDGLARLVDRPAPASTTTRERNARQPVRTADDPKPRRLPSSPALAVSEPPRSASAPDWTRLAAEPGVPAPMAARRRVDLASLSIWCGDPRPPLAAPTTRGRVASRSWATLPPPSPPVPPHVPPGVPRHLSSSPGWIRQVGERAARRLRHDATAAPPAAVAELLERTAGDVVHRVHPEALSLSGPTVPDDRLRSLGGDAAEPRRSSADPYRDPHDPERRREQREPDRTRRRAVEPTPLAAAKTEPGEPAAPAIASPRPSRAEMGPDAATRALEVDFGFPPLALGSRRDAAWAHAEPTRSRAGARAESRSSPRGSDPDGAGEAVGEDDLEILAEKIKRILNDEARRFGMDV